MSAELSGLYQAIERLKWEHPISYHQAFLEARGDGPQSGRSFWPETRKILDENGITEDGIMTKEATDILRGATERQLSTMPPKQRLRELLTQNRQAIMAAMPKHMNPDRLLRVAQTACTSTPQLMECYVPSLLGGIMQAAQFGLEPNTPMGHCYLVPYRRNLAKRGQPPQYRQDCQLIIGYRGLIDLARRSGQIVSISAHCVRKGDFFEWEYGLDEKLRHKPAASERGDITHAYAVAKLVGGGHAFEVMTRAEVDNVMLGTQSGGKWGPWRDRFEPMARKTAIRMLAKYIPMTVELAEATEGDSRRAELGKDGEMESVVLDGVSFDDAEPQADVPGGEGYNDRHRAPAQQQDAERPAPQGPDQEPESQTKPVVKSLEFPIKNADGLWMDSSGAVFDERIHARSRDGTPATLGVGTFRARRGTAKGRPQSVQIVSETGVETKTVPFANETPQADEATPTYDGPSVDEVMRMIRENVADLDGYDDVTAILADMPDGMLGKDQCLAAVERARKMLGPAGERF